MKKWYAVAATVAAGAFALACADASKMVAPTGKTTAPRFAASGVAGATYTTNNPTVDGLGTCGNGPNSSDPTVNCNIYDQKRFVWLTGGPTSGGSALEDGTYFFAVLDPGGQHNDVNDGENAPNFGGDVNTNKNLSDEHDAYTERMFVVHSGRVVSYLGSTHDTYNAGTVANPDLMIRLIPYTDTPNPGGEYDMAICQIGPGYNPSSASTAVESSVCKYDNFKVRLSEPPPPTPDNLVVDVKIAPSATNAIGEQHVFTVTATVAGGTKPYTVTIGQSVVPTPDLTYTSTCPTAAFSSNNNSFVCTITINSSTAGAFVANATLDVVDAGSPAQHETDQTAGGIGAEGPATKTYVAATLSWNKTADYPAGALAGATFKIERIADRFGAAISPSNPVISNITDCTASPCAGTDKDPAGGAFRVEGIQLGTWRITETAAPAGYSLANPVYQDVVINDLSNPTGSAASPFLDPIIWIGETATVYGFPWTLTNKAPDNWFMFAPWTTRTLVKNGISYARPGISISGGIDLIAGQHFDAGQVTGTRGATTSLTITLASGFRFALGSTGTVLANAVKINPMACTFAQNYVQPGQFSVKATPTASNVAAGSITVSGLTNTDCYGIHVDVQRNPFLVH